jgi:alpha-glucosidase
LLGYPGRATLRGGTKQWAPGGECGVEQEFAVRYGGGLFDDTKVFAEMGKYVTFARRKGKTWFIITIGGFDPVSYSLALDFLEKGKSYKATIYSDDNRKAKKSETSLVGGGVIKIVTEQNGGHLMILE